MENEIEIRECVTLGELAECVALQPDLEIGRLFAEQIEAIIV